MHNREETDVALEYEISLVVKKINELTAELSELAGDLSNKNRRDEVEDLVSSIVDSLYDFSMKE